MNDIEKNILNFVQELLEVDLQENLELNLINNGLDSIKVIQLLIMIEEYFNIEFTDEDLQMKYFISVKEISMLVSSKIIKQENRK